MKTYSLIFFAGLLWVGISFSCINKTNLPENTNSDSTRFAELTYIEDFYDVGTIQSGEIVRHSYQLKNTGNKPLVVMDIIPSCGCTQTNIDKKVLKPGELAILEVTFDSRGWYGTQYKSVTLRTNGIIREKSVTLKANVVP